MQAEIFSSPAISSVIFQVASSTASQVLHF